MLNIKNLQRYKNTGKKTMLKERIYNSLFISFFPGSSSFSVFFLFFGTWTLAKPKNQFFKKLGILQYTEKTAQPNSGQNYLYLIG